jgi:anti-sigma factor (TIGR02949 family)
MSCGKPHELDCSEALQRLDEYLDGEIDAGDHDRIAVHLQECAPCLREFDIERVVKKLVARSCCLLAPQSLRARLVAEIIQVRRQDDQPAR